MAKYRDVLKTEKYMDDAADTILSNIVKGLKRRKQLSIWDPIEPSIETESYDSDQSERNKILTKILSNDHDSSFARNIKRSREENEFASGTAVKRNDFANRRPPKSCYPNEPKSNQNDRDETKIENSTPEEYDVDIQHDSGSETLDSSLSSCPLEEQGNTLNEKNDTTILLNNSVSHANLDVQSMDSETFDVIASQSDQSRDFTTWCKRRQEQFNISSSNSQLSQHETKAVTFKTVKKDRETAPVEKNKITDHAKKYSKSKSELDISDRENKVTDNAKKYSKSKSEVNISDIGNKKSNCAKESNKAKSKSQVDISVIENIKNNAKKYSKSKSEDNLAKTQVSIKLANENYDKCYELNVDVSDIYRIKRRYPKLNDILPDIDTASTTVPCCCEAVNIIFRYLFFGRSNLSVLPNATIAVEVLAASKKWEIENFYSLFYDIFEQKILPSSNIKFIYSQASHYNLHEVCRACQKINNNDSVNSAKKRKQKTCSISVTTYIEPLEFCIPLHTMEHSDFELNFERHILNTIRFQALSGSFTIVGMQINLNNDHIDSSSNNSMLYIDYNAKNVTRAFELGTGRCEKPIRPINVIHFKNPLEVNLNDLVEISVETDLKPLLCSTYPEEVQIRKKKKGGEFRLNLISNFKIPKSNENVFIVGKLLYYVRNS